MEAIVVSSACPSVLASAGDILRSQLGEEARELQELDDPDWRLLPAVGAALRRSTATEQCFAVLICPTRSLWAVGVGMRGKHRFAAPRCYRCYRVYRWYGVKGRSRV